MKNFPIKNVAADGFRICWLDTGTDWLGVFSELRAGVEAGKTDSARLLQTSAADGKFVRKTWKVRLDAKWGGGHRDFQNGKNPSSMELGSRPACEENARVRAVGAHRTRACRWLRFPDAYFSCGGALCRGNAAGTLPDLRVHRREKRRTRGGTRPRRRCGGAARTCVRNLLGRRSRPLRREHPRRRLRESSRRGHFAASRDVAGTRERPQFFRIGGNAFRTASVFRPHRAPAGRFQKTFPKQMNFSNPFFEKT